ncbi:MAG: hypothetical protein K0U79_10980 [Gammaproteobacteria bacterium]|nr:hypothetical protein [Gammaproteobacteria bacterium]
MNYGFMKQPFFKFCEQTPLLEERISAAREVIQRNLIDPRSVGVVISTGIDRNVQPSDAVIIASSIGAKSALAASINNSCVSVVSALDFSRCWLAANPSKCVVVSSSSNFGEVSDNSNSYERRNGVGAMVLSYSNPGLRLVHLEHFHCAEFFGLKVIKVDDGAGAAYRFEEDRKNRDWVSYRKAVRSIPPEVARSALRTVGWDMGMITHWVLHSSAVTSAWREELGIKGDEKYPNTGSLNSILQISSLFLRGFKHGERVAVIEVGLGMTVGIALFEWSD